MSIKINFNGVSILKPGSFSVLDTSLLTDSPISETGTVAIIGEADRGEPRVIDILSKSQIQSAKARYGTGPIPKVLDLIAQPSNDPRVPNGASKIIVYKTNLSTVATKTIATDQAAPVTCLTLTSENYGIDENNISVVVAAGDIPDSNAHVHGTVVGPFTVVGTTLVVNHAGVAYTYTASLGAGPQTAAAVLADINNAGNWAPSKILTATEPDADDRLTLTLDNVADIDRLEYGIFDIAAASTLDTVFGVDNLQHRGVKGDRVVTIAKGTTTRTSQATGGNALLTMQYTGGGTACAVSVQDVATVKTLTTVVTAGIAADTLSIDLSAVTLGELVAQINANANYTCTSTYFNRANIVADTLIDFYLSIDAMTTPLVLYDTVHALAAEINANDTLCTAAVSSNIEHQLTVNTAAEYFSGGTRGTSANTNFQDGFDALKAHRVNIVIPLLSADQVVGSATIGSVNAQLDAHCALMASTLGKSERNGYASIDGTKTVAKAAAQALNSRHVSMTSQQITALNELGSLEVMPEYVFACMCAGIQAGTPVGEPITYKSLRISDLTTDSTWDPLIDYDEMIEAGVTFAEPMDAGGFRVVCGNTTYSQDSNIVYNRISINEAGNFVAYELRAHLEGLFTGTKARTGSATAIKNAVVQKLICLTEKR